MQIGPKIDEIYVTFNQKLLFQISRFLDVANASSMPHLLGNLILTSLFFTEPFYLVQKLRNVLSSILHCKSSKFHKQPKAIQLLEYQTDVWRCRFDTLGKLTCCCDGRNIRLTHRSGAHPPPTGFGSPCMVGRGRFPQSIKPTPPHICLIFQ